MLRTLKGHDDAVTATQFSTIDGHIVVSASRDTTIRVWHVDTAESLATLAGHADAVTALSFSLDGWLLASASNDCSLRLWSVADAKCVSTTKEAHKKAVSHCCFHPEEPLIYSAATDGTVRIWNVEGEPEPETPPSKMPSALRSWRRRALTLHPSPLGISTPGKSPFGWKVRLRPLLCDRTSARAHWPELLRCSSFTPTPIFASSRPFSPFTPPPTPSTPVSHQELKKRMAESEEMGADATAATPERHEAKGRHPGASAHETPQHHGHGSRDAAHSSTSSTSSGEGARALRRAQAAGHTTLHSGSPSVAGGGSRTSSRNGSHEGSRAPSREGGKRDDKPHKAKATPVKDQAALASAANDAADLVCLRPPCLSPSPGSDALCGCQRGRALRRALGKLSDRWLPITRAPSLTTTPLFSHNPQEVARSQLENLKKELELERSTRVDLQGKLAHMRNMWELDHTKVNTDAIISKYVEGKGQHGAGVRGEAPG